MLVNPKVYESEWKRKAEEAEKRKAEEVDAEIKKAREEKEESVVKFSKANVPVTTIAECLNMSVDVVKEILSRRNGGTLL